MSEVIISAGEKREIVLIHNSPESAERVIRLSGEGAEVNVQEIFISGGVKSNVIIIHDALGTKSRLSVRGVVDKGQRTVSHAKIVIPTHGQLADSFVSQQFMLLDDSAQVEAIPSLEIEADEVKASHATAICTIDAEKLFYLKSRGVAESEARKLIIDGFLKVPGEKWQA